MEIHPRNDRESPKLRKTEKGQATIQSPQTCRLEFRVFAPSFFRDPFDKRPSIRFRSAQHQKATASGSTAHSRDIRISLRQAAAAENTLRILANSPGFMARFSGHFSME